MTLTIMGSGTSHGIPVIADDFLLLQILKDAVKLRRIAFSGSGDFRSERLIRLRIRFAHEVKMPLSES